MLKINDVERWNSVGNEFIKKLKNKGIEHKVVFKDLEVFRLTNIGIAGGKKFDIIEYIRPSNGKRTLVANGGFAVGDWLMEEIYIFNLKEEQIYTSEEVAEAIRNCINAEYEKREEEEKRSYELRNMVHDEVKEVARTLTNHSFEIDFEIPEISMNIDTSIVDIVRQRLDDREVDPVKVDAYFLKADEEDMIIISNSFDILGQNTSFSIYIKFIIEGDSIVVKDAY